MSSRERDFAFTDGKNAVAEILSFYGLNVIEAGQIRKIIWIRTEQGVKCLKKSRLSPRELLFIHDVKEYLAQKGFKNTDRFILTGEQLPFVVYNGSPYTLTNWVTSREADYNLPDELILVIRTLTDLHRISEGFYSKYTPPERHLWDRWLQRYSCRLSELDKFYNIISGNKRKSEFDQKYLRHFNYFYRQGETFLKLLAHSPYDKIAEEGLRKRNVCHHDFSCRNLLITPANHIYLIDFDYCICDIRLHDLGSLIIRNMKTNKWDLELARFILKYYHALYPLSRDEFEVLWIFLIWPQDYWQVGLQYYEEKQPWPKKKFLKLINKKIEDIKPREEFLRRFPELWPIR